jgi:hypothetical protein
LDREEVPVNEEKVLYLGQGFPALFLFILVNLERQKVFKSYFIYILGE